MKRGWIPCSWLWQEAASRSVGKIYLPCSHLAILCNSLRLFRVLCSCLWCDCVRAHTLFSTRTDATHQRNHLQVALSSLHEKLYIYTFTWTEKRCHAASQYDSPPIHPFTQKYILEYLQDLPVILVSMKVHTYTQTHTHIKTKTPILARLAMKDCLKVTQTCIYTALRPETLASPPKSLRKNSGERRLDISRI